MATTTNSKSLTKGDGHHETFYYIVLKVKSGNTKGIGQAINFNPDLCFFVNNNHTRAWKMKVATEEE